MAAAPHRVTLAPDASKLKKMDALRQQDIAAARAVSPAEKLRQALELMTVGIELKRANLARSLPGASEQELANALAAWLESDD